MKEFHIPSVIGLLLLLVILVLGLKLSLSRTNLFSRASANCEPQGVQITNLTHHSLDLSFITKTACTSALNINNLTIKNFQESSLTHYFRVNNLNPNTQYLYSIIAGGKENKLADYKIKTPTTPSLEAPTSNLAWGKVFKADQSPSPNTIVYLTINGALPLSALTDNNGQWHISLATSFSDDGNNWFTPTENQPEDLIVYPPDGQVTQINHNTSQNDPVPDITIGQNFLSPSTTNPGYLENQQSSFTPTSEVKIEIRNPSESETITSSIPDIFGLGPSNSQIQIKLESNPVYQDTITTKADGTWNWSPPSSLSPGLHTLTVTYRDVNGLIKTAERKFYVQAADNIPAFSASPSATIRITPTSRLTPTITLTPTIGQNITSITPTTPPTSTPIISTPSPIPTIRTSKPSTSSGVPVSGVVFPGILLLSSSVIATLFSYHYAKRK